MGVKLVASSGGSVELVPTNTASNFTVTVPAKTGTMAMDGPAFSAYVLNGGANYSLASNTYTKIRYDTEIFDTANCFDTVNYRFTPNVAGYYFVTAKVFISYASTSPGRLRVALYKNGTIEKLNSLTSGALYENIAITALIYMNGTTDYLEAFSLQTASGDAVVVQGSLENEFSGSLVRAA